MASLRQLRIPTRDGGDALVALPEEQASVMALRRSGCNWDATAWNQGWTRQGTLACARTIRRKLAACGIDTPLLDPDGKKR